MKRSAITLLSTSILAACGGSSSGSNTNSPQPNDPNATAQIIALEQTLQVQQATELVLFAPDANISAIQWRQTAGEPVILQAPESKVMAFTPPSSGNYQFSVSFNQDGSSQELTYSIDASAETAVLSARLGHAVVEGNKVSLRAWKQANGSVSWQQLSGPTVNMTNDGGDGLAVFFDAPEVAKDTLIQFELTDELGHNDQVAVLIENAPTIGGNAYFDEPVAQIFPYHADSPFANNLVACVYSNSLTSSCQLAQLPLIAQTSTAPTVDDIMDRVVVSHRWMGDRFKEFITNYDPNNDFKNLLRATTAIVISYDVRPSFYWAATGAIYLDAENFWLSPEERDTINEAPDYRSAFGQSLQFIMPWRYVKNNQYVSSQFPRDLRLNRTPEDGLFRLTSLMFHELAHANDFFPSAEWHSHPQSRRILDAALNDGTESDALANRYPLQSDVMRGLARVSFAGASATATQESYLPNDVATFFRLDSANDYYNYSSEREDLAMLFDELMMFSRYGIARDVAVTNLPTEQPITGSDYIVAWGERGRIGQEDIKPRVTFVANRVLPELNTDSLLNALPEPVPMRVGDDWFENLILSTNLPDKQTTKMQINQREISEHQLIPWQFHHKALPKH